MKKLILIFFAVGATAVASAQVQFGVKANYNLANVTLSGDASEGNTKYKSDFSAGLLASLPLFNSFYLQPEVVYSGQGFKTEEILNETGKLNLGYINVPVLFKFQHETGLFAETGPQVGFLLSAKSKFGSLDEDVKDQFETIDFSWAFGIGYKIPDVNLGIDLRYNLGLTNIAKDAEGSSAKNSVFQFGLFYTFGGGSAE